MRFLPDGQLRSPQHKDHITPQIHRLTRVALVVVSICAALALPAHADVSLLLEEPINFLGHLTSSGHASVWLEGTCSPDRLHVQPCSGGEPGVVISRVTGAAGHDWLAIPLNAYLFSVDSPAPPAAHATAADIGDLRETYRSRHHAAIDPQLNEDLWIRLLGGSYRRTIIRIHIHTTEEQDARLRAWLNASSNRSHFNLFWNNCADFAREVLSVLFPGSVHRNLFFDAGITTPKQLASTLHHFAETHPAMDFQVSVLPQVPGPLPRSGKLYGVTEAFVRTKPYLLPLVILQPIGIGTVITSGLFDHRYRVPATLAGAPPWTPDTGSSPVPQEAIAPRSIGTAD